MKNRKLENRHLLAGSAAAIAGVFLLAPLATWLILWQSKAFTVDALSSSFVPCAALAVGGLGSFAFVLRDRLQSRFIGEVETFVMGRPVLGEALPVMCVIPARRDLEIRTASALLFWNELAVYQAHAGREMKRHRTLLAEHYAGDGTFQAGDVLRHKITLLLPSTPPPEQCSANWRTAYKVSLTLQLNISIAHCPDVREEYEVAVLEEHGM